MNQLELHKKIEEFFKAGVVLADVNVAQNLLVNDDAKRFFFSLADSSWLDWLWQNGLLNGIKNKSDDLIPVSYQLPELDYMVSMAEKDPAMVTEIILDKGTATKEGNLNLEVINRFLWIMTILPAEQIKLLTAKIRDEKWSYLMRAFRKTGYEFENIVKKLVEHEENEAILELAQAIFSVKSKTEISEKGNSFSLDDPFYVSDLSVSGIFEALANIQDSHKERAIQIATGILEEIVKLAEPDETGVFNYTDLFALYDVDFFTLEIEDKRSYSYREDIKNLAATIKKLVERAIGEKCSDQAEAKKIFKYIDKLPSCRSTWRLRLFTLAQCPEVFKDGLKEAFFKLFSVKNYYEIEGGTEYKKSLKIAFPHLSDNDQRDYVTKVFQYFSDKASKDPDKVWIKRTGWEIMSSICSYLKDDEPQKCEQIFGSKCDGKYEPEPSMKMGEAGIVNPKSPVNLSDYTIDKIIANLKSEWTEEKLNEQFKRDDFLSPRGVEGLSDALKEDIKKRTDKYLDNINGFFDRGDIHPHYMYSLLRGIEEMLRNKQSLSLKQIGQILGLFEAIKNEGEKNPFRRRKDESWLVDWIEVHTVITDILLAILSDKTIKEDIHKAHRNQIRDILSYLFTIKDSPSKENEKPDSSEPYHVAINSVRGRAYEAFVVFTENDGKTLANDIKEIYKNVLSDDSLAIRFVIGRYIASFYFRDKEFIVNLLSEIFPKDDPSKKDLYLASWEGYLSNILYDKLFVELRDYYSHAITLDPKDYTQRKYSKGLDESLAIHLALAFAHLGLEIEDSLFTQFWAKSNIVRHKEFISFIGQSCLNKDVVTDEWLKENKVDKGKLLKFWDWALDNSNVPEPEDLSGFGFWINPNKEIIDDSIVVEKMAETLKRSRGSIYWDYGLLRRLPIFAEKNGEKTLEIIFSYLIDSKGDLNQNHRASVMYQPEFREALKIIHKNGDGAMRQKVTELVNTLIEKGSSIFWGLKEILV
jgi:hypothetical protein